MAPKTKKANKKGKAKKSKAASVPQNVKQYVDKKLDADIEDKCVQINAGGSFGNVLESPDFNAYPMAPLSSFWTISQGVGQGGRIGNRCRTKKVMLSYVLRPNSYDATFNVVPVPCVVQLLLGYVRNTPNTLPTSTDINNLFQNGGSVAAPIGQLRDVISIINKDYWVIKKRWAHKLGFGDYGGTGFQIAWQGYNNNDYQLNVLKMIDITRHLPATLAFNDNTFQNLTKNLFLMYYAVSANGAVLASTQLPIHIDFWIDYHYEDA